MANIYEKSREILLFGFDDDEANMKFERQLVPDQFDLDHYLQEQIEKLPYTHKGGMLLKYNGYSTYHLLGILSSQNEIECITRTSYLYDVKGTILSEGGGWIYDLSTNEAEFIFIPSWEERGKAKNRDEAIEYISTYLAKSFGRLSEASLKEIGSYASEHGVPFCASFMTNFVNKFNLHQPQWNSSSAYC